jgi:hypothetical protein
MVVKNNTIKPQRKKISARFSNLSARLSFLFLMDRKESRQLLIKEIIAKAAPSSIKLDSLSFVILTEVSTMKQKPNRLAEVLSMCGDLLGLSSSILFWFFYL